MNVHDAERRTRELFSNPLRERGFARKGDEGFEREQKGALQRIGFSCRLEYRTMRFRFDVGLGVRFPALERLLSSGLTGEFVPSIGTPIHLLREDKRLYEWYLDDPAAVGEVIEQIDRFGIPFLEKFSDLVAVKRQLESQSPMDWFHLGPERRTCFLGAIALLAGDRREALRLVESALDERKNAPEKKRWLLEEFRSHVLPSSSDS